MSPTPARTRRRRTSQRIRAAAAGWLEFWDGRLDLDTLAWETVELLNDITTADARIERATQRAQASWHDRWGHDPLLRSVPGIGPVVAPVIRGWFGDAAQFDTGKQAASFVGLNPSNWESGMMATPSRPITKEGPPELRLAFYQAANIARRRDPGLAVVYRRLMVERGHNHIKANCAIARKLTTRVWATLTRGEPYEYRDLDGQPIDAITAANIAASITVPDEVRRRLRARAAAYRRDASPAEPTPTTSAHQRQRSATTGHSHAHPPSPNPHLTPIRAPGQMGFE